MHNLVLWTLDNETDGDSFERLCTDLMFRVGYKDIVPVGGSHDRGRDAEIRPYHGIKATGGVTFFQFTLEKAWEKKLKKELKKVHGNKHEIEYFVFATIQSVTGNKRDKLARMAADTYKWQLVIFDREWFRLRLEEADPDLAAKYLGIPVSAGLQDRRVEVSPPLPARDNHNKAWMLYKSGQYETAIVEFKELLKHSEPDIIIYQAIAWCQYSLYRYNEALAYINKALALDKDDIQSLSLKGCILTEDGVRRGIKANLLLARDILKGIADKSSEWIAHYNYGNVLQSLGDYEGAMHEFHRSTELNPDQAEVWKNLGSVYFHLHNHEEEINCYDKALALNNRLSEAFISKGVTLLKVFGRKEEAAELIERGIRLDEFISLKWPHAWYWLAVAHYENANLREALKHVNTGLSQVPDHYGLLTLKSKLLAELWRSDKQFMEEALTYFKFRIELDKDDYNSVIELAEIYMAKGQKELVWNSLAGFLGMDASTLSSNYEMTGHSISDLFVSCRYFSAYKSYRKISRIGDYAILLHNSHLLLSDDFYDVSFVIYSIPFGLACDMLSKLPKEHRPEGIAAIKENILSSLRISLPRLAAKTVKSINKASTAELAEGFATVLLAWPDIGLMEFSRQVGYIGSIFGVTLEKLDWEIIKQGKNLGQWQKEVMEETLFETNKVLKIFKE